MAYTYTGLGQDKVSNVTFWWNKTDDTKPNPKYRDINKAIKARPPYSSVLCVNVYANESGNNRLIGSAVFPMLHLIGGKEARAPIHRVYNNTKVRHCLFFTHAYPQLTLKSVF